MLRLQRGNKSPDFEAYDYTGRKYTLKSFVNLKNVLLVCNRGLIWPYCRRHMTQLRQQYQLFTQSNTEIIVIGPDTSEAFKKFWEKEKLPFIGIPDLSHKIADLFGQEVKLLKLGRLPAEILVDISGVIRYAHYGTSMSDIAKSEVILATLKK